MNIKYFYRKTRYYLRFLTALMMAVACTDDPIIPDVIDEDGQVPIVLNLTGLFGDNTFPSTYALRDSIDVDGTGLENHILDVTVFIFNANTNVCDTVLRPTPSNNTTVGPSLVPSGYKKIVVVANGNEYITGFGTYTASTVNYSSLRTKLSDHTFTALPTLSSTQPFLMTGEETVTLVAEKPHANSNKVDVVMQRAVAKVKVFVTKDRKADAQNLTLQSIRFYRGANRVAVLQNPPSPSIQYNLTSPPYTAFFNTSAPGVSNNVIPSKSSNQYCQLNDSVYVFESIADKDTTNAVYFELEVSVNGSLNYRKGRVYLAQNERATDTLYNVYRNYWYNVYVNIVDPGMDSLHITVKACPWNVADTIKQDIGRGYEATTSVPFKLVKYYTPEDTVKYSDRRFLAIDKHSKGASWIDLTVTKDARWKLKPTDGVTEGNTKGADTLVMLSQDAGLTWHTWIEGVGTNTKQRLYIYRLFDDEENESKKGPSVTLEVDNKTVRTFVVESRDSLIFPTNSYVLRPDKYNLGGSALSGASKAYIPLNHVYDFWEDFICINGDSIPVGTPEASLSWRDSSGNVIKEPSLSIISPSNRKNSYIYLEAGDQKGNAVVNFKVGNTVYWSFHIWNTEYSPYEPAGMIRYATTKNIFMDRNLGAFDTLNTSSAKGLFYQFGRKDPFADGVGVYTNNTQPGARLGIRPLVAIPELLKYPTRFYTVDLYNHSVEDNLLWNSKKGNKTAFDPCPEGYRIPVQTQAGLSYSPWNNAGFNTGTGIYTGGYYSPSLKYYTFAYFDVSRNLLQNGVAAYYWTSHSASGSSSSATAFNLANNNVYSASKATGAAVRCVVDGKYKGTLFGRYTNEVLTNAFK